MKRCQSLDLVGKIQFGIDGYSFKNLHMKPVITIDRTVFKTEVKRGKGIIVTNAFEKLPKGFIVLFSYKEITTGKSRGAQSKYQLALSGNRYMQMHTTPQTKYGLANFINAAASKNSDLGEVLHTSTTQDMKRSQCSFVHSIAIKDKDLKERFPAYVRVDEPIPQGHELLLPSSYGGKHRVAI